MTAPLDEKGLLDRICHKEQIGIWANEVLTALSLGDFLREEWTFDDSVDAEREIEAQLRSIIASAISHPEYDLLANLEAAEAQVLRLTEENEAARAEEVRWYLAAQNETIRAEAAEARIKALEEAQAYSVKGLDMIHNGLMDPTRPRQAVGEVCAHFLNAASQALKENAL